MISIIDILMANYIGNLQYLCYYNDMNIELEIFHNNRWHFAANFSLAENNIIKGYKAPGMLSYQVNYVADHLDKRDYTALSCMIPVKFDLYKFATWPPFLLDLLPSGAGRRAILNFLNIPEQGPLSDWPLLLEGAGNPPGNIRVKQAVKAIQADTNSQAGFKQSDIIERAEGFIEYAYGHGAPVAGSSGVQGDAPKFLLTQDHHDAWHADGALPDEKAKKHWLVKFPRGHLESDYAVLRNEFAYYSVAVQLGLRVHGIPEYNHNTLFVPRFDRAVLDGKVIRFGQESLTSLVGIADFGNAILMKDLAIAIVQHVTDPKTDLLEFLYRDITNLALGNTDNHGRNTAIRKLSDGKIELAPIFDFAPMILDNQGISRSCRWGEFDNHGDPDWNAIAEYLAIHLEKFDIETHWIKQNLRDFADQILALPGILISANVDLGLRTRLRGRINMIATSLKKIKY